MTNQQRIGYLVKTLREKRGMTQRKFGERLGTSQSAVARMEAGGQNFTTKELGKISNALESKLLSINEGVDFRIEGGWKLHSVVTVNYSKNGVMGLICASLLNRSTTLLHNIPKYEVSVKKLRPAKIVMYESSDTATENILLAAARIPGKTMVEFATSNYQVQEACFFLEECGVKINGIGTSTLEIQGIKEINKKIEYWNSENPIEAMMFLSAAITTNSKLKVKRCPIDFLKLELLKLKKMGLKFSVSQDYFSKNGRTKLVDIQILPSKLKALPDKIHAQPYPGINTDNLPFFVPIATQAVGTTLIHDWMWENRAI